MAVSRIRGLCRICGKNRVFGDEERKLCKECTEKYQKGIFTDADIVKRVQGRKPQLSKAAADADAEDLKFSQPAYSVEHPERLPKKSSSKGSKPGKVYRCEHCNAVVKFGAQKCSSCGGWLSWLGTAAETDPDLIICPSCGTSLGTAAKHLNVCPKCNYGGGSEW